MEHASGFLTVEPFQLIERHWTDDELNRQRSLATFKDEIGLVDKGLTIYVAAIQSVLKERSQWENDDRIRASIAMLIHAFNSFLARRHLLTHGYYTEASLFVRSFYEVLCQAFVFINDETLARRFYEGKEIRPRKVRNKLSSLLASEGNDKKGIYTQFNDAYNSLSSRAHPTLESFSTRTAAQKSGIIGLQKSVPEDVVFGGLLQDDLGRVAWLGLARGIVFALAAVGSVLKDARGEWDRHYEAYHSEVMKRLEEHKIQMDQMYPEQI